MMLRPATPLAVMLFIAFALLLMSVLSTPIIKAIPLGSFQGVDYGVFGFCKQDGCSGVQIGYDTASLATGESSFDLPSGVRGSLSSVIIIHPVAAALTLACCIMALAAHMRSSAHSPKYLLILALVLTINSLACAVAFLADVLLFSPHLAFGTYLVIAAAVLVLISTVVSWAMRRTLMGRKARQKRVAQNAEMSGENYFNREAQKAAGGEVARQPTVPMVSGANGRGDALPTFASYENQKEDQVSDERIPLTQRSPTQRSPIQRSPPAQASPPMQAAYAEPARSNTAPPQDMYGHPMGPQGQDAYGGVRRGPSFEQMNSRGRGGMPPGGYRGRGGPGGYGRGGYGPPPNRGGYGGPGRGGYGPPRGGYGAPRGAYGGPPPRGNLGSMRGGRPPPPPQLAYGNVAPFNRQPSPMDGYGGYAQLGDPYGQSPSAGRSMPNLTGGGGGGYEAYQPSESSSLPRAESPPPLPDTRGGPGPQQPGEIAEMDATPTTAPSDFNRQYGSIRDSDTDVAGMVALQQPPKRVETYMSDGTGSKYSTEDNEQYVPARTGWTAPSPPRDSTVPEPLKINKPPSPADPPSAPNNTYYEDVDARFAGDAIQQQQQQRQQQQQPPPAGLRPGNSFENTRPERARSPAESDRSNFTSVSQRGVNPRWNPNAPPPVPGGYGVPPRRPPPPSQRQDMLFESNPDFQLGGGRAGGGPRGGGGIVPGSSYPGI